MACRCVRQKRERVRVSANFTCADGQCTHIGQVSATSDYFIFSPIDSWPQPALSFYKRVFHPLPLTGVSLIPPSSSTGVAMPTLPFLFAALFVATAQAAVPSFGHNVVPYIPQASEFLPVSVSWAVLMIFPVILL